MKAWNAPMSKKQTDEIAATQANRKCPESLKKELQDAIRDNESADYIEWLKGKIARYSN